MAKSADSVTQQDVVNWFDQTYARDGFDYLRPLESYPIFLQLLGVTPGQRLLDVACGPGLLLKAALMRELEPSGVDISSKAIEIARDFAAGAHVEVANAQSLPFESGTFDYVTCIGAIERFFDREAALTEMKRVLRDDGRCCFMVRNSATIVWHVWRRWLGKQNHEGHQDALSLEEWRALFSHVGLATEAIYIDQWFRQKVRRAARGFRRHDFSKPEPVAKPILPLRLANEFIFLLKKA